jgi:hypothetical protein
MLDFCVSGTIFLPPRGAKVANDSTPARSLGADAEPALVIGSIVKELTHRT